MRPSTISSSVGGSDWSGRDAAAESGPDPGAASRTADPGGQHVVVSLPGELAALEDAQLRREELLDPVPLVHQRLGETQDVRVRVDLERRPGLEDPRGSRVVQRTGGDTGHDDPDDNPTAPVQDAQVITNL
jgi:hypothetical protein